MKKILSVSLLMFFGLVFSGSLKAQTYCSAPNQTGCQQNITISWTAPVIASGGTNPTSYNIMRGTSSGSETLVNVVPFGTNSWIDVGKDNGAIAGQIYFYEVVAVYATGNSAPSNEVSAVYPSSPPAQTPAPTGATAQAFN